MLSLRIFLLLATTTILTLIRADNEFCGCQSLLPSSYINPTAPAGQSNFTNSDQCWAACYAANNPTPAVAGRTNYRHSTFQKSSGQCACTDKYPPGSAQRNGEANNCAVPTSWDNRIVQTTFIKYPTCYTTVPANIQMTSVTGPDTCSYRCGNAIHMIFFLGGDDGTYQCGCGTIGQFPPKSTVCGQNQYFIYYHTAAQASQGLSRRKHREELLALNKPKLLCPEGLSACRISEGSSAFECIDTNRDIDSCGGCMFGAVDDPMKPKGEVCYAPGVAMGASTCNSGTCIASKCKRSHHLVDGKCIKQGLLGRKTNMNENA